jgi:hypothetical protein
MLLEDQQVIRLSLVEAVMGDVVVVGGVMEN